jgi:hypothetical protein
MPAFCRKAIAGVREAIQALPDKEIGVDSRKMGRSGTSLAIAAALLVAGTAMAQQRQQAPRGPAGNALEVGKAGAWGIYSTGEGRAKTCFLQAQPAERLPRGLNRDPAYAFVSMRQGEAQRSEFAVITGYPLKGGAEAQATVGTLTFAMLGKDKSAWLRNPAEEARFVAELRKATSLTVKGTSARGNETTDRYSLTGFGQALERAQKECS